MIFLAKGICTLGQRTVDENGNVVKEIPAKFETDPNGGSVAVGVLDDETGEQIGQAEIFGDYDPWGYLSHALKLLAPTRAGNIPDFMSIVKGMHDDRPSSFCRFLNYCDRPNCRDCIVQQWIDEFADGEE